jgi:hypothetical protein
MRDNRYETVAKPNIRSEGWATGGGRETPSAIALKPSEANSTPTDRVRV